MVVPLPTMSSIRSRLISADRLGVEQQQDRCNAVLRCDRGGAEAAVGQSQALLLGEDRRGSALPMGGVQGWQTSALDWPNG